METELRTDDNLKYAYAPIRLLSVEDDFNPRSNVKASLDETFLGSIRSRGILQPLFVRKNPKIPGHFLIIDGERRFRAAKDLQMEEVPVFVFEGEGEGGLSEPDALLTALISNEHKELPLMDKARAYAKLQGFGIADSDLANALGVSERTLKEFLVVIQSNSVELQKAVETEDPAEQIPSRVAARVASLPQEVQEELLPELKGQTTNVGLDIVRETETKIGKTNRGRPAAVNNDVFKAFAWASDAKKRAERLYGLVMAHLTEDPSDERTLAHLELLWVLQGDRLVEALYPSKGKPPKKIATAKKAVSTTASKKPKADEVSSEEKLDPAQKKKKSPTTTTKKMIKRKSNQQSVRVVV